MAELVFATFLIELKESWIDEISDPDLIMLLYDAVADPVGLKNKMGDAIFINKTTASKVVNRKPGGNPLKSLRRYTNDTRVTNSINVYFENKVIKQLHPSKKKVLFDSLLEIVNTDEGIKQAEREKILAVAQMDKYTDFLVSIYLYTLTIPNVLSDNQRKFGKGSRSESLTSQPLEKIPIPIDLQEEERKYADALLAVYGQKRNIDGYDFMELGLYSDDKEDFNDNREYYFAAEAVRRGTRDFYHGEQQFDILKEEIYQGVKEVWKDSYKNGYSRLLRVLTEATKANISQCILSRETQWIWNAQRKGVCHFLVNDRKLKGWIRDDDGQFI